MPHLGQQLGYGFVEFFTLKVLEANFSFGVEYIIGRPAIDIPTRRNEPTRSIRSIPETPPIDFFCFDGLAN